MPEPRHLLRDRTTLRLGGPARRWVTATTEAELVEAVDDRRPGRRAGAGPRRRQQRRGRRRGVRRGGRRGRDPRRPARRRRRRLVRRRDGDRRRRARSGTSWSPPRSARGWVGVEALSGIPGSVGATPIQNVGAYGQEVSQTVASVRVWDRRLHGVRTFANADCGFGYRHSRFKADPGRHVVLDVTFQLAQGSLGTSVTYAELVAPARDRAGGAGAAGAGPRGRAGAARRQGHGARRRRPRHVERRLVLHQPGGRRRACCPTTRRPGRSPTAGSRPARRG